MRDVADVQGQGMSNCFFSLVTDRLFCKGGNSVSIMQREQKITHRPWRQAKRQHRTPIHGRRPRARTAHPTLAACQTPTQHTQSWRRAGHQLRARNHGGGPHTRTQVGPWRQATHQHNKADHGCGPGTRTSRPSIAAGHTPAKHTGPWGRTQHLSNISEHITGTELAQPNQSSIPSSKTPQPTMEAGLSPALHTQP